MKETRRPVHAVHPWTRPGGQCARHVAHAVSVFAPRSGCFLMSMFFEKKLRLSPVHRTGRVIESVVFLLAGRRRGDETGPVVGDPSERGEGIHRTGPNTKQNQVMRTHSLSVLEVRPRGRNRTFC